MTAKVILNPFADRWRAGNRRNEVEKALKKAGVAYEMVLTEKPKHAIELARQAVKTGFNPIIAAGGDGTYHEVVNGIATTNENDGSVVFGVLPLGSVDDLAVNLGIPRDLEAAANIIAQGNFKMIDLCNVNGHFFDNNAAVGLEAHVTLIQQRLKRLSGSFRYLTATFMAILENPKWEMHLEWEGGKYSGPITLVTVGNSPLTGGLFYMTPHANPFDGLLTFVYGYMPTRTKILSLLPRTMKPEEGNYVEHPAIDEVSSPWLLIRCESPAPAHADGEIFSEAIQELEYKVFPQSLPILLDKS